MAVVIVGIFSIMVVTPYAVEFVLQFIYPAPAEAVEFVLHLTYFERIARSAGESVAPTDAALAAALFSRLYQ